MIWLGARAMHGVMYVAGITSLRILAFAVGLGMSLWIAAMAL
jgi:uncharacterized MAPEG superfamily protein